MNSYCVLALLYIGQPKAQGGSNLRCLLNFTVKNGMEATISKERLWHKLLLWLLPQRLSTPVLGDAVCSQLRTLVCTQNTKRFFPLNKYLHCQFPPLQETQKASGGRVYVSILDIHLEGHKKTVPDFWLCKQHCLLL